MFFINETFATNTLQNGILNTVHRTCIAYTEGKIIGIIWRCVLCTHKPYFLMPGHKLCKSTDFLLNNYKW